MGKTTLLLQHLKMTHGLATKALYLSLDDIRFSAHRLIDLVAQFYREGGLHLYLDEVHKYPNWAIEVKNLYDTYPDLQVIFTGSALLEIQRANADLSRRAIIFHLQGLSFRQYLALSEKIHLPVAPLADVLERGNEIISDLPKDFKPYAYFRKYLERGYYPFFYESESWFHERLAATVKAVLESDMVFVFAMDPQNIRQTEKLLLAISSSPPFKPNVQRLSERTGISRNTLSQYMHYLQQADMLAFLFAKGSGLGKLNKPDKLYLENSNLLYALSGSQVHIGMARETFVFNQLRPLHEVAEPPQGDFLVDNTWLLEVGGASKGFGQIAGKQASFVLADDLDFQVGNKVPIWLMGLLY